MDELIDFVVEKRRGLYRPAGNVRFDEAVAQVRAAIAAACSAQARDLLVDTTALTGFDSPSTFQRFLAAVEWAEEAKGRVLLAMVARKEMVDPHKIGVTVAANRGVGEQHFRRRSRSESLARRPTRKSALIAAAGVLASASVAADLLHHLPSAYPLTRIRARWTITGCGCCGGSPRRSGGSEEVGLTNVLRAMRTPDSLVNLRPGRGSASA